MNNNPKIIVLRKRRLIPAGITAFIFIVLVLIFIFYKSDNKDDSSVSNTVTSEPSTVPETTKNIAKENLIPGLYTSCLSLDNSTIELEVCVDNNRVKYARIKNIDESIKSLYPLIEDTMKDICEKLKKNGTTSDITYPDDSKYTYLVLIDGINQALKKASK